MEWSDNRQETSGYLRIIIYGVLAGLVIGSIVAFSSDILDFDQVERQNVPSGEELGNEDAGSSNIGDSPSIGPDYIVEDAESSYEYSIRSEYWEIQEEEAKHGGKLDFSGNTLKFLEGESGEAYLETKTLNLDEVEEVTLEVDVEDPVDSYVEFYTLTSVQPNMDELASEIGSEEAMDKRGPWEVEDGENSFDIDLESGYHRLDIKMYRETGNVESPVIKEVTVKGTPGGEQVVFDAG